MSGVFVGPRRAAQPVDPGAGARPARRPRRRARSRWRSAAQFLLDYIHLLLDDRRAEAEGFRHQAPGQARRRRPRRRAGRERWVINKLRALCTWYTKGLDGGSHLRIAVNSAESIAHVRDILASFFLADVEPAIGR